MKAKEAVKIAKQYVHDILEDENITEIGLEEINYVDDESTWEITIGFRRPFTSERKSKSRLTGVGSASLSDILKYDTERWYRIISIDDESAKVIKMTAFELQQVA